VARCWPDFGRRRGHPTRNINMRPLLALGLLAVLSGFGTLAQAEEKKKDDKKQEGAKIVGKWEITKTDLDIPTGTLLEFTKDGKFTMTLDANGVQMKIEGTYKVEKDKLLTTAKIGDQSIDDTDTIKKLTADVFEIEGKDGKVTVMKKKK
jgi:uncharacterized protein (TIGR03066 family)